jgi:diguanylate cyclase (GGDEF)-like protein
MSKNVEQYLKTLYSITSDGGVAGTKEISRRLHVAPASVTEMLKKLDEQGYLKYSPYRGAVLTDIGLKFGERITRKHRLLERFLCDILKLPKENVHSQACDMEHTLNDEAERALCKVLKHRNTCPDDQKVIPPCDLPFGSCDECQKWVGESIEKVGSRQATVVNLSTLREHEAGHVAFIRGDNRLLSRLSDLGLTLGARVEITGITSDKAPVEITIRGSKITLDRDITFAVFVQKTLEEKAKQGQETVLTINRKLEERNRQNSIMSEMRELLQSCSTIQEMPPIVVASITKLFPNADGALFLMNGSRKDLQSIARWGDFPEEVDENVFEPDACWALRRGRIHEVEDVEIGPICPHLKHPPFAPYMCLPLIAKGDILGLLHLRIKRSTSGEDRWHTIVDLKETVVIFAEYLSLSIANIRLWERLTDQSIRDPLTGLFNRRYMEEIIQREILRAAQSQTKIGIIMADIDHFKGFNDMHGHEAGDELLMKIADFFKYEMRGSDIACRYGGEEFILVLPGASTEGTYKRAERLREEVKNLMVYFRNRILPSITLSMGIATYPDHGTELNDLIQAADSALYRAKEQGRDRIVTG